MNQRLYTYMWAFRVDACLAASQSLQHQRRCCPSVRHVNTEQSLAAELV